MITWNKELYHSWGKSPKQKAREKEYNHWYYLRNKEKWLDNIKKKSPIDIKKEHDEDTYYDDEDDRVREKYDAVRISDKKKNYEFDSERASNKSSDGDKSSYSGYTIKDTKGKGKGRNVSAYRSKWKEGHDSGDVISVGYHNGKKRKSSKVHEKGPVSITRSNNGVDVDIDVKKTKKYANIAKKKIEYSTKDIISSGKKKYKKYMSTPATKPSATTKKNINRRAKNLSKENRVAWAKNYRNTKRILKKSGYVPNGTAKDRYRMDSENQSRVNNDKGYKINVYSSKDNWDDRLKKKKKKR